MWNNSSQYRTRRILAESISLIHTSASVGKLELGTNSTLEVSKSRMFERISMNLPTTRTQLVRLLSFEHAACQRHVETEASSCVIVAPRVTGGLPPEKSKRSRCRSSKVLAETEFHCESVIRPISHDSMDPRRMPGCHAKAYVCVLHGDCKHRAFRGIEKRKRIVSESKPDQPVSRGLSPAPSESSVVDVQCGAFVDQILQSSKLPQV